MKTISMLLTIFAEIFFIMFITKAIFYFVDLIIPFIILKIILAIIYSVCAITLVIYVNLILLQEYF